MNDKSRRKELSASYKQSHPEAGVFRIVNARNGKVLLGSAANLASMRNKLEFARSTSTPSALDRKLQTTFVSSALRRSRSRCWNRSSHRPS
jgi:hypothetical protein